MIREYLRFHQDKASTPFYMVIMYDGYDGLVQGEFIFYREELDGEIWNIKIFAYLSEAFAYFAQQLKECGR